MAAIINDFLSSIAWGSLLWWLVKWTFTIIFYVLVLGVIFNILEFILTIVFGVILFVSLFIFLPLSMIGQIFDYDIYIPGFLEPFFKEEFARKRACTSDHDYTQQESSRKKSAPTVAAPRDPFQILGLTKTASKSDLIRAYREKMKLNHPDRAAELDPEIQAFASERAKEINLAYEQILQGMA